MPQTILALLAIVAATVLTLQVKGSAVQTLDDAYENDAYSQARGVAVSVLERLSAYPFDGGEGGGVGSDTTAYSRRQHFGTGSTTTGVPLNDLFASGSFDDLDDFHGVSGAVASRSVGNPTTGGTETLDYDVSIVVTYAKRDPSGDWISVLAPRAHHKMAFVRVDHYTMDTPLQFGRVYTAP